MRNVSFFILWNMFLKVKTIVYPCCANMWLAQKFLKCCAMCVGEPLQRLVVKFFIFFRACAQLYKYITFADNQVCFLFSLWYISWSCCVWGSRAGNLLLSVFFSAVSSTAWRKMSNACNGKGPLEKTGSRCREVWEEIKPEATTSGGGNCGDLEQRKQMWIEYILAGAPDLGGSVATWRKTWRQI